METLLREKIKQSGYKGTFLAKHLGVTPVYFYMCMNGKRNMDPWKQKALKELLGM